MKLLKAMSGVMNNTTAYRLWQAPFAKEKLAPVLQQNTLHRTTRVLDIGCGPGTNCDFFRECQYTGFDINPAYVEYARSRFGRNIVVQDVCTFEPGPKDRYDWVLMNSLLHHLDDDQTRRLLQRIANLIQGGGAVHIIDLVLPERKGIPRWLAWNDRGDYPRTLTAWKILFDESFRSVTFQPFSIRRFGVSLWDLVYFKGESH